MHSLVSAGQIVQGPFLYVIPGTPESGINTVLNSPIKRKETSHIFENYSLGSFPCDSHSRSQISDCCGGPLNKPSKGSLCLPMFCFKNGQAYYLFLEHRLLISIFLFYENVSMNKTRLNPFQYLCFMLFSLLLCLCKNQLFIANKNVQPNNCSIDVPTTWPVDPSAESVTWN